MMDSLSAMSNARNKEDSPMTSASMILESGFSLSEQAHEQHEDEKLDTPIHTAGSLSSVEELRQRIVQDVVGSASAVVTSPLEWTPGHPAALPLVYCDFTASHRPLQSVEAHLQQQCLPYYGNTHTNTCLVGSQSTAFCSEARQIVGEVFGAKTTGKASADVVLFAGNGTTSAVELLIDCLGLKHHILRQTTDGVTTTTNNSKPVIFVGPYEHHSNLLPWRELGQVDIEMVRLDNQGNVDLEHLKQLLEHYQNRDVKIGAFSAASNVTGIIANDIAITALLHTYGALSIWDYATAASYLDGQMNPTHPDYQHELIAKDAILFSGHKLLGGVGTPGVLIIKKHLVSQQNPPTRSGGGTVFYVTAKHHRFLSNRIERFEGGTPNIVGIWRLGLALTAKQQLKKQFQQIMTSTTATTQTVLDYDLLRAQRIQQKLSEIPNLVLMDGDDGSSGKSNHHQQKLPIFSFLIKCGTRFLHYNYVCTLLNDIFGIQSRGGCQCAGPYAQYLLGLNGTVNAAVEECLVHSKDELLRPGFTRLSLPTFGTTEAIANYVLDAISWVAQHGWKLMHVYRCNHRTGEWRHKSRPGAPLGKTARKWLSHYKSNVLGRTDLTANSSQEVAPELTEAMAAANRLLELVVNDHASLVQAIKMSHEKDEDSSTLSLLRWYVYPKEVALSLQQGLDHVPGTMDKTALVGAVRPIAWFPVEDEQEGSPIAMSEEAPSSSAPTEAKDTHPTFQFREGEHTGTASLHEIRAGFDDGELTEACLVYQPESDSWSSIAEFLQAPSANERAPTTTGSAGPTTVIENAAASEAVTFRDGEHSGLASWEEIEVGYDDGELSSNCQIYDSASGQWEVIDAALERRRQTAVAKGVSKMSNLPPDVPLPSDVPVIEKHEKKKPQRDSAAWGQGCMVAIHPSISSVPEVTPTEKPTKQKRHKHVKPPAKMMRLVTQAIIQWDMLEEGDRLLLGLSGGKDSLSLLHVLLEFKKKLPINFEIEVCTIDPMTPSFDPSPLIPYVESLGLKYHYIRDDIVERAANAGKDGKVVSSLCSFCARMKRGNLYTTARKNNCNKLVLAQHLDDLAESFMMSVMHNGFLRTMKANYRINAGDLSVIRPLAYCRESVMTDFAKSANLPIINENCPACFEEPKERARIKKLLAKEESLYPYFYDNIKRSLLPLMHDDATAILRSYTEEALDKSRKETHRKTKSRQQGDNSRQGKRARPNGVSEGEEEKKESTPEHFESKTATSATSQALADFGEEELVRELARRRAERFRLAGAMKRVDDEDEYDPTGQVCSLNGGNGTIPCRELME